MDGRRFASRAGRRSVIPFSHLAKPLLRAGSFMRTALRTGCSGSSVRALAALVGAALALAGGAASAAEPPIQLRVQAPSACTDADRLRAAIEAIRGPGQAGARAPFAADVEITGAEGDYRMVISIHAAGAPTRELADPDCRHLADAAAVVLALAIEDAEQRAREAKPPKAAPAPSAGSSAVPPPRPGAQGGARVRDPVFVALAAGALFDIAALPAPAPGFTVRIAAGRGDAFAEAALVWLAPERAEVGGGPAGGEVSLIAGALRACWTPLRAAALAWGPCAGVEVGAARGVGFGVAQPGHDTEAWVAPQAGLRAGLPLLRRLALTANGDALFPLIRPHFRLEGVGPVYQPPPVTGRFSLGVEVRLW